ncbi:glucose-6-phosphate dehydrogenase assembly protein OpcA [Nigerium massiliense]|uniref:glucose-6-phosphate dehydrogenase assembly protein OpcA n=1 Tax=Nigerium massiliense TaxID=1522317 RepID=UPI000693A1BC|nr:glucose-6-phosphate dehydrogenase assembly protein OpcA [Nigerium massiliense]
MIKTLKGTTAQGIQNAITAARRDVGAASGLVFTLVVITDLREYTSVLEACIDASREHPSRVLIVTNGAAAADRVDAEIHLGEDVPGEIISLRFQGDLTNHRESVVLPLLLPDSPVIAWWPGTSPVSLADDPLGSLAIRRISDSMGAADPIDALEVRARNMTPGDTDLTWTRLTPWRALLVSALDQYPSKLKDISIAAEVDNAAGVLLASWLDDRLDCNVSIDTTTKGPGITSVELTMDEGTISIRRSDGKMASYSAPKTPARKVALPRRDISQLLTEELRRIDPDDILQNAMKQLLRRVDHPEPADASADGAIPAAKGSQVE